MDTEQEIKQLFDRLAASLREVQGWEGYVDALAARKGELLSSDDLDLTDQQIAAMMFWRIHGLTVNDDYSTTNEFDQDIEDEEDFKVALEKWVADFEENQADELKREGSLEMMAGLLLGH